MSLPASSDFPELLRRSGLHVTAQRLAVLRWVEAQPHALADELCERVREQLGTVSRQAVYDALNTLTDQGILRRIQPAGATARYELAGDNHHHLVCRACGRMVDTHCVTGPAPCLSAMDTHGFRIDEAEILFWGLCPDCQTSANPIPSTSTETPAHEHE